MEIEDATLQQDFKAAWNTFHPQAVPIYYRVRGFQHTNIFRFHVLPDSRAEARDYREICDMLRRYNALAADVLMLHKPCWMIVAEWAEPTGHPDYVPGPSTIEENEWVPDTPEERTRHQKRMCVDSLRQKRLRADFGLSLSWEFYDAEDTELVWRIHAGLVTWNPGRFNKLLRFIHRERLFSPIWMNAETGALFAPYQAGVDVALPDAAALLDMIDRHPDMIPTNGHGTLSMAAPIAELPESLRQRWLKLRNRLFSDKE